MKTIKLLLLSILASLVLCNTMKDMTTFAVNVEDNSNESEFLADWSYVRLSDTTPMLSEVKDIRLYGDRIYVRDKTEKIFIFSKDGRFVNVIDKCGHGANEYLGITDFDVYGNSIYVLSCVNQAIFEYDESGNVVNMYELNDYYTGLRLMKPHLFLLASR